MDSSKLQSILIIDGSTKDIVLSQLKRILSSSYFRLSPQLGRFLSFVVESVLSGQVHQIKQYTIAVDAFGYREDFDPQMNPAMRVLASRLRKMLKQYYLHDGVDDEVVIDIPKRTYIPIFRTNLTVQTQNQSESTKTLSQFSVPDYGLSVCGGLGCLDRKQGFISEKLYSVNVHAAACFCG